MKAKHCFWKCEHCNKPHLMLPSHIETYLSGDAFCCSPRKSSCFSSLSRIALESAWWSSPLPALDEKSSEAPPSATREKAQVIDHRSQSFGPHNWYWITLQKNKAKQRVLHHLYMPKCGLRSKKSGSRSTYSWNREIRTSNTADACFAAECPQAVVHQNTKVFSTMCRSGNPTE